MLIMHKYFAVCIQPNIRDIYKIFIHKSSKKKSKQEVHPSRCHTTLSVHILLRTPYKVILTKPSTPHPAQTRHHLSPSSDNASQAPPPASTQTASQPPMSSPTAIPGHYTESHRRPPLEEARAPARAPILAREVGGEMCVLRFSVWVWESGVVRRRGCSLRCC
jgi:hypothetical protein